MDVVVIDGHGGGLGKQLVTALKNNTTCSITAVGTNSMATSAMLKAGAAQGATGENAVIVTCRHADVIVGPIGIAIPDSLLGEITPAMAQAVGQSPATKVLIPMNKCDIIVCGCHSKSMASYIDEAVQQVNNLARSQA